MGVISVDASVEEEAKSISLTLVTLPRQSTLMLASDLANVFRKMIGHCFDDVALVKLGGGAHLLLE